MDRQVHQLRGGPGLAHAGDRDRPGVRGAVVHDPEHPAGRGVGLGGHDLGHQLAEGGDTRGRGHPAHQLGAVDVVGAEVGQGAAAGVLELHPTGSSRARAQLRMAPRQRLELGLLIGADDVLVIAQRPPAPCSGVEVEHPRGLGREVGVAGEDPRAVLPELDRVLVQPAAHRGYRYRYRQAFGHGLGQPARPRSTATEARHAVRVARRPLPSPR